ncbi:MAG: 16S rRNA (guanine(966)-N(2))-methyltransferase RsmD [Spirochaetia bacterium]
MRITGGNSAGIPLAVPKKNIRPAMDRMRESVFASLGHIQGCSFLDLFSGSGSIGLEAASRGAEKIVLVEKDYGKRRFIEKNAQAVRAQVKIFTLPAEKYLKKADTAFDIIFLDPPFPYKQKIKLLHAVTESEAASEHTEIIIHFPQEDNLDKEINGYTVYKEKKYGRSMVWFYKRIE